jgi:hypothetical protein
MKRLGLKQDHSEVYMLQMLGRAQTLWQGPLTIQFAGTAIHQFQLSESIAKDLMDLFQLMFLQKRRLTLILKDCVGNSNLEDIFKTANELKLLDHVKLGTPSLLLPLATRMEAPSLCLAFTESDESDTTIQPDYVGILGSMSCLKSLHLRHFGIHHANNGAPPADRSIIYLSELLRGLEARTSLEELEVHQFDIEPFLPSIQGHPNLRSLFFTQNRINEDAIRALQKVFGHEDCQISKLRLFPSFTNTRPTSLEIDGIRSLLLESKSLRYFSLHMRLGTKDADRLLSVLWKCPQQLECLDLRWNEIASLEFPEFYSQPKPCRLRQLNVFANPVTSLSASSISRWSPVAPGNVEKNQQWLRKLLEACPELYQLHHDPNHGFRSLLGGPDARASNDVDPEILNLVDLNRTGRVLIGNCTLPLSIWPIVLARTNRVLSLQEEQGEEARGRQANVLFQLLRGTPAIFTNGKTKEP